MVFALVSLLASGCGKVAPETTSAESMSTSTESANSATETSGSVANDISIEPIDGGAATQFFAMDTVMEIAVYGPGAEDALRRAADTVRRLDALLAAERENSDVAALNESGSEIASYDLIRLVSMAQDYYEATDGAFNICLYPVKKAWGFTDQSYRVPTDEELQPLLALADPLAIEIVEKPGMDWGLTSNNSSPDECGGPDTALFQGIVYGNEGMEIDLGGIAKGYTANELFYVFRGMEGVNGALINLGGNVMVVGNKPDDSSWRVGIRDPEGEEDYIATIELLPYQSSINELLSRSVVTSGGYERYFEQDGVRYHHILDPATGRPAESDLVSVTICTTIGSDDATAADAFSTALYVMGLEKAIAFWRESGYVFEMALLDTDGVMHVTENLAERFSTEYPVEVITY